MSVVGPSLLTPASITMATGGTYAGSVLEAGRSHGVLFDSSHTAAADGSLCLSVYIHICFYTNILTVNIHSDS